VTLALESLKETGGRFRGELIVTKAYTNWASGKVKSIHFLESFTSLVWIAESIL